MTPKEKQLTAVEYYESLMKVFDRWLEKKEISIDRYYSEKDKLIKQVKAIEKKQIKDAWDDGQSDGATICTQKVDNPSEQYYTKPFKSE